MAALIIRPLTINQCETFRHRFRYLNPDKVTPVILTDFTAVMQIKKEKTSTTPENNYNTLTTQNKKIVIDGHNGIIDLIIPKEETALVTWESGEYDLYLIAPDGTSSKFAEGPVLTERSITSFDIFPALHNG